MNQQWFLHSNQEPYSVDHLYSSFIYRKELAEYPTNLSPVCFREESILTYNFKLKGYKNIIQPKAISYHYQESSGGIRSHKNPEYYKQDEKIFLDYLKTNNIIPKNYSHIVLDSGIGDHYCFKKWFPEYRKLNEGKTLIFYTAFPEVFSDIPEIQLASIRDAQIMFGNLDQWNVYKWCDENNWNKSCK